MSKVSFYGLGGLGENGKNMYVVDVDNSLFILDAGVKYPTAELYGVDVIVPDYKAILAKKNKIRGIFLSHAHEDHIGALIYILAELNVPVYATNFTMEIVKDLLVDAGFDLTALKLHVINPNQTLAFGKVSVSFFETTHSIPESVGIAVHTPAGVIVYTSDFNFSQSADVKYQTDFRKINALSNQKIIALLTESVGTSNISQGDQGMALKYRLNEIFSNTENRIIVSLFSSDLQKIQTIIDIALEHQKKIAIIGRRAQRIVDIAIKEGYLTIPPASLVNLRFIDERNQNDAKDLVCLVTGSRHEPFYMLQRMTKKIDRLVHITKQDTVIIMTAPVPGIEKMAARTLDVLYRADVNIEVIDKSMLATSHASQEEVKLMINMLKPENIIPVIGEYRHQYQVRSLARELGYDDSKVFLLDNGDVVDFTEKGPVIEKQAVKINDILIDGTPISHDDVVLRDRELLGEDGVILIVASINPKTKKITDEIQIETRGFIYVKESGDIIEEVKKKFIEISQKHLKSKYINWSEYKRDVRDGISRYLFNETKRRPITIPVLISVTT